MGIKTVYTLGCDPENLKAITDSDGKVTVIQTGLIAYIGLVDNAIDQKTRNTFLRLNTDGGEKIFHFYIMPLEILSQLKS